MWVGLSRELLRVERVAVIGDFSALRREGLGVLFCHCTLVSSAGTKRNRKGFLAGRVMTGIHPSMFS